MNNNNNLNLALIPKELTFILEILNEKSDDLLLQKSEVWLKEIDWHLFFKQAMHHRVYPLLFSKLKKHENLVPLNVLQTLQHEYKRNTFQMLHLTAEMEKVSELLTDHHIQILFLKGPMLGSELYGDISLRTSGDLDVLVPLEKLSKVEDILIQNGYEKNDYFQTVLSDWKWRHHHITFFHPKTNIKLEVHWRLNPGPSMEPCFNELWERKRISEITSYPTYILGNEDLFFFLVTHGARHGWSRLRWLIDIHQIVKKEQDWVALNKTLRKYHYQQLGGQAMLLSSELLGTTISKGMKPLIQGSHSKQLAQKTIFYLERMVNLHTEPVPEDISKFHQRYLYSLMSTQQKFLYILSWMYPYPTDVETLPLPKKIHFLYFPLRPILCMWRKMRKQAFS
ncbi:nucleotidyltransferase domain-containing protein [Peribacillus loiseleuriae]|uniref:Renal dipeptidase n=1 Tax=Peribacillus loiseleuriae TaxID=1679170 RepID=A0A0K9H062_9BACI|nr:nucleotidyltransferase family protein [Peribacillus loiseleuriae]KMY51902.1 Renal dipeptidase [Peribacillus loiseleuriae]